MSTDNPSTAAEIVALARQNGLSGYSENEQPTAATPDSESNETVALIRSARLPGFKQAAADTAG